jgi:hypothetical protein
MLEYALIWSFVRNQGLPVKPWPFDFRRITQQNRGAKVNSRLKRVVAAMRYLRAPKKQNPGMIIPRI